MDHYTVEDDLKLLGMQVKSFPVGIPETFDKLHNTLPHGNERDYYGISHFGKEGQIVYYTAASTRPDDKNQSSDFKPLTIDRGEYYTITLQDWKTKTDLIKDIFHHMMQQDTVDNKSNCIEWYRTDKEMLCMMKAK